jgi:hypothetical protein
MAWTQTDIDALKAAIATGVRDVQYSDNSRVTYRSLDEMRSILAEMEGEVAGPTVSRARTIRVNTRSGF